MFGYEKGAFTGALSQKMGRFELAHRGTLFLDEVGDIPLDLQPKLLRALQEKSFERLGGIRTIPIDVRLVAATNRNLTQMMGDKLFRSDLYYRLKVFPITTPPLRDHPEDIPILARHFTQKYARKMNKQIEKIPADTMRALVSWSWPGNVRELENFIERAVILSGGRNLRAPLAEIRADASEPAGNSTLEQVEREHIIRVLRETARSGQQGGYPSRNASDDLECPDAEARHLSQGSLTPCIQRNPLRFTQASRAGLKSPSRSVPRASCRLQSPSDSRHWSVSCSQDHEGEEDMNWDQLERRWQEFAGSARAHWNKVTDDDWGTITGRKEQLVGTVQARYGIVKAEAERQVDEWADAVLDIAQPSRAR